MTVVPPTISAFAGRISIAVKIGPRIDGHGKPQAVVLGFADWQRLSQVPSFGRLLMSAPLETGDLPQRNRAPMSANVGLRHVI